MKRVVLCGLAVVVALKLCCADCRHEKPCPPNTVCPKTVPRDGGLGLVAAQVGGNVSPDGTEIHCDLPGGLHQKNTGGSDGAGLCVYASARHAGRWQNNELFEKVFDWMRKHPGGSYPEKFKRTLEQCAQELSLPVPPWVQVQGGDLEILKAACKSGRMPGVTYSFSPTGRYGGGRISHMVSLAHADDKWFCVLDNNYPGADKYEWMSPAEFSRTYAPGWAVILLTPPPPPPPK
jgi:hypothetical protein